jgi:hypothetical protein
LPLWRMQVVLPSTRRGHTEKRAAEFKGYGGGGQRVRQERKRKSIHSSPVQSSNAVATREGGRVPENKTTPSHPAIARRLDTTDLACHWTAPLPPGPASALRIRLEGVLSRPVGCSGWPAALSGFPRLDWRPLGLSAQSVPCDGLPHHAALLLYHPCHAFCLPLFACARPAASRCGPTRDPRRAFRGLAGVREGGALQRDVHNPSIPVNHRTRTTKTKRRGAARKGRWQDAH